MSDLIEIVDQGGITLELTLAGVGIQGPAGNVGPQGNVGPAGPQGAAGTNGTSIPSGAVAPSNPAVGDLWIDTSI